MLLKFLISSILTSLVVADFKYLSKIYTPTNSQDAVIESNNAAETAEKTIDFTSNDVVGKNTLLTKDTSQDPAYGNFPFGYNGFGVGFPGAFPNQGFPGQGFPPPVLPPQQGLTAQGFPGSGYAPYPNFVNPGFPQHGFPQHGFPQQGFPVQSFPGQGYINPGFPGQSYPNFPIYFSSSEQQQPTTKNDSKDDNLSARVISSDTKYDSTNGGYFYDKPAEKF